MASIAAATLTQTATKPPRPVKGERRPVKEGRSVKRQQLKKTDLVVSTPLASEPQCSKPLLQNCFSRSSRSDALMSMWRCSLISWKIQGFISAPLHITHQHHQSVNLSFVLHLCSFIHAFVCSLSHSFLPPFLPCFLPALIQSVSQSVMRSIEHISSPRVGCALSG